MSQKQKVQALVDALGCTQAQAKAMLGILASEAAPAKAKAAVLALRKGASVVERVDAGMTLVAALGAGKVYFAGKDGVVRHIARKRIDANGRFTGTKADFVDEAKWTAITQVFAQ